MRLVAALQNEAHREAAADHLPGDRLSGVTLGGVGSAFWGVVAGALAMLVTQAGRKPGPKQDGAR
jgi:benzoate membrane transport protein